MCVHTETFDGNDRIWLGVPCSETMRRLSWLYSEMRESMPSVVANSRIRSRILREARRAGLKTTISVPHESAMHMQNIATEKVFPKRRGVETMISLGLVFQSLWAMMEVR